jgi:hypothetical protein
MIIMNRIKFWRKQLGLLRKQICQFDRLFLLDPGKAGKSKKPSPRWKYFAHRGKAGKPCIPGLPWMIFWITLRTKL